VSNRKGLRKATSLNFSAYSLEKAEEGIQSQLPNLLETGDYAGREIQEIANSAD
jgi:hypothetical protein